MNLTKLTEDLNIHQSLPDQPTLATNELKQKFDEAGNKIKDYINSILTPEIQTGVDNEINSARTAILKSVDSSLEELEASIDGEIESKIATLKEEVTTAVKNTEAKSITLSLSSGVSANQRNFKLNNMIMLDSLITVSIAPQATKQVATIPEEYRPKETITFTALGSSLDSDGTEFGFDRKTVTITPAGVVNVSNTTPNELGKTTLKYLLLRTNYLV
jgi:hypothetical protein